MEASQFEQRSYAERFAALQGVVDPLELAAEALVKLRERGLPTVLNLPETIPEEQLPANVKVLQPHPLEPEQPAAIPEPERAPQVEAPSIQPTAAPAPSVPTVAPKKKPVASAKKKTVAVRKKAPVRRQRRFNRALPAVQLDKPFADITAAAELHPDIFKAKYDDNVDNLVMQSMVKHHAKDDGIMSRLYRVYRTNRKEADTELTVTKDTFSDFGKQTNLYRLLRKEEEVTLGKNLRLGVMAFKKMEETNDFSDPVLQGLAREGAYSYQAFFYTNLRLALGPARSLASAFPGADESDLLNHAYLGIHRAIEKFDPTRNIKFSTYATWWYRQSMWRGGHDDGYTVGIPTNLALKKRKLNRLENSLQQALGRAPTLQELIDKAGLKYDEVVKLQKVNLQSLPSLNQSVGEMEDSEMGDLIADTESGETIHETLANQQEVAQLFSTPSLSYEERLVLSLLHGIILDDLVGLRLHGKGRLNYEDAFDNVTLKNGNTNYTAVAGVTGFGTKNTVESMELMAMNKIRSAHVPDDDE